ncbi:MAG: xanthine dehydrogenase family protein subunit M, partial [Desulfobacterales bacterium]|nr:xanthine dehydrogenase family protein subunit M [Desulfobacterales bacterium]
HLIDIKGVAELDYIRYDPKDGLRIGALTTHRSLEKSDIVKEKAFMLSEMERTLASSAVRNWGTVGGNLSHADPASDLAPALLALGAEVSLTGPDGVRVVNLDDFFVDFFETAIRHDEIMTEIHVPNWGPGGGKYYKFARRATDMAIVSVAVQLGVAPDNPNSCRDIRVAMGAVGSTTLRSKGAEDVLKGQEINDALIEEAARLTSEDAQPMTDINGTREYKREVLQVIAQRAIKEAWGAASGC